jgi:hypothetical protein
MAFKVYIKEEQQRADKERRDKTTFQMLAQRPPTSNSNKGLRPLIPKARKNPGHLPVHVFGVALKDTGSIHVLNHATHQGHILSVNRRATE